MSYCLDISCHLQVMAPDHVCICDVGAVSQAIVRKGGRSIQQECQNIG